MKGALLKWFVVVLALYPLTLGIAYIVILNSWAFREAVHYARNNQTVVRSLGGIHDIRLAPYYLSFHFRNNDEQAELDLWLRGSRRRGSLIVQLKTESGIWQVRSARLYLDGGEEVAIEGRQ